MVEVLEEKNRECVVYEKIVGKGIKCEVMEGGCVCDEEKWDLMVGVGGGRRIECGKGIGVMGWKEGD